MEQKFSDGSASAFTELPVPAAYLSWTRGNAALKVIAQADPGAYFGGWRAFVIDREKNPLPSLPLPIVERSSQDGQHTYQVYAHNYVNFLPLQHRTRFELREKYKDETTGQERERIISVSRERRQGFTPYRQVFGLLFANDKDEYAPAVLKVWKWSAFITFERAGQAWNKVKISEGQALVRRYGSIGKDGKPIFETFGQGHSTPIEAIGVGKPRFVPITPEMNSLWEAALPWKNCERWNAEGKFQQVDDETKSKNQLEYERRCEELGFTNIDIDNLLKENGGDYVQALAALDGSAINAALENADEFNQ